ncbi:16875_t:CDS:2, partial [Cetraspora pellucida]
ENNIFQSINYSNENEKMHIDDNDFSSIELETATKNNKKYLIESVDSFYETEESEEEINKPEIANSKCKVLISNKKGNKEKCKCGVIVHTQGSTTNFATYLLTHGIVKLQLAVNKVNNLQPTIDIIFKKTMINHINQKEAINQALVEFIIKDSQPFYLLKSHAFIKFINLLDSSYELPSDKYIKTLIHQAFNYSTNELKTLFDKDLISYNLTSMCYVPYPHDSKTIAIVLEEIINNWELNNKVDYITSDNAINMIKAINIIKNIDRILYAAYTLQLAIRKGLKPAKILVIRTKRLINFLLSSKQTERLIEAQKQILEQLTNLLAPFAEATTLLGGSTYSTLSFMLSAIKVLLQNCKPKANDYEDYQIESEFDNDKINYDDITTIFDEEEIIVDYNYDNKIEITIDAKKININEFTETKGLVYKVKATLYEALKHY